MVNNWGYRFLEEALAQRSENPHPSIEVLARDARIIGLIDDTMHYTIQHSTPFTGTLKQSLREIGLNLGIPLHTVIELLCQTYANLARYVLQPGTDNLYDLGINLLPWEPNRLARRTKTNLHNFFGKIPTVEQIITHFNELAASHRKLDIPYLGKSGLKITQETFGRVGLYLPDV